MTDHDDPIPGFIHAPAGLAANATWSQEATVDAYGQVSPPRTTRCVVLAGWRDGEPLVVDPTTGRLVALDVWFAEYADRPDAELWVASDLDVTVSGYVTTD